MIQEFGTSLQQRGLELNMYLSSIKKTQDDLKKEWRPQAEKQVKNALILREVAKIEKLVIKEEELNTLVPTDSSEPYDVTRAIELIFDQKSYLRLK